MKHHCRKCGAETDIMYTDGGGLAIAHGQYLCRKCYIEDGHPECPNCHELTAEQWKFCAHCGNRRLPTVKDITGLIPDFTGELSSDEYIKQIRDDVNTEPERLA